MKKAALIIGIVIIILAVTIIAIPVVFKKSLLEKTKTTINAGINAKVGFSDIKLSLIRNFPKITLELKDLIVTGTGVFANDTLLSAPTISTKISLASLFAKEGIALEEITFIDPFLNLKVDKAGKANWDIVKESGTAQVQNQQPKETSSSSKKPFELQLENIVISNATILYNDKSIPMLISMKESQFNLKGKMYGSSTELSGDAVIGNFLLDYDSVAYISNSVVKTNTVFSIDFENWIIKIKKSEWWVNKLPFDLAGDIKMPGDSILFDLDFKAKKNGFGDFLTLIPPGYEKYLEGIETEGSASMTGYFKGLYLDEDYPAFSFDFTIGNGRLKYAKLPEQVRNISANVNIWKPQGSLDLLALSVKNAHAEVGSNPVDFSLALGNIYSNLSFDFVLNGKVNFDELKKALPLEGYSGKLETRISAKGNYNNIELKQYDKIKAGGTMVLSEFNYTGKELSKPVSIPSGKLDFNSTDVNLSQFKVLVGSSDMTLTGKVTNYLNYYFSKGIIEGSLQLRSEFLNLNELANLQVNQSKPETTGTKTTPKTTEPSTEEGITAISIPNNLNLVFTANVTRALFDKMPITNINGIVTAKDGILDLRGLNMNMLDGELKLNGSYSKLTGNNPDVDLGFTIVDFDIPSAFKSLKFFRQMAPIAGQSQGKLSAGFSIKGKLTPDMETNFPTLNGSGFFNTTNLQVVNSRIFDQLKGIIKTEKLKNVKVDDFTANFTVEDGNLLLKPFNTKIAGQETKITGKLNTQNLLDMNLSFNIEREAFGEDVEKLLQILPGQENIKMVPAGVNIVGPVNEPSIKVDLEDAKKLITNEVKKSASDGLKKLGNSLKKLIK